MFSPSLWYFHASSQVLTQLKKLHFSKNGDDVSFDANGDPVAKYELVNWQKSESDSIEMVTVGHYDASLPEGQEFSINRNLTWVDGGTQVRSLNTNHLQYSDFKFVITKLIRSNLLHHGLILRKCFSPHNNAENI